MKIENRKGLRIITPESPDYILYSVERNTYHEIVYLGKNDSVDNYKEMERRLLNQAKEDNKIEQLLNKIKEQDALISKLAKQLADLTDLVNKNR